MKRNKRRTGVLKSWIKGKSSVPLSKLQQKKINLDELLLGRVIATAGRFWIVEPIVQTADSPPRSPMFYLCTVARSVISENPSDSSLLAVGDRVRFQPGILYGESPSHDHQPGIIYYIERRHTKLARAKGRSRFEQVLAANVDQLCIMVAVDQPPYNRRLIDRYLVAAAKGNLDPCIIINKIDLIEQLDPLKEDLAPYSEQLQVPVFWISVQHHQGLEALQQQLYNKISVLSGPSGVGKSTLVNTLIGDEIQITAAVGRSGKGMHTTTASRMFRLPKGGYIVDTPGIREFSIWEIRRDELRYYFPEFQNFRCRFSNCTHIHEPDCGVRQAASARLIDPKRYESYRALYASLPD